jgi:hypothetical protein
MGFVLIGLLGLFYIMVLISGVVIQLAVIDHFVIGIIYWIFAFVIERIIEGRKWKVNIIIKERRGEGIQRVHDKYKRVKKDGEEWGELRKKKVRIRPIPFKFIEPGERGSLWAELFSPASGEYHPVKMNRKTMTMKAKIDPYFVNWVLNENQKAQQKWRKESAISKLLSFMPIIIIMVTATIMLVIFMDQLLKISEPLISSVHAISVSNNNVAEALKMFNDTLTGFEERGIITARPGG